MALSSIISLFTALIKGYARADIPHIHKPRYTQQPEYKHGGFGAAYSVLRSQYHSGSADNQTGADAPLHSLKCPGAHISRVLVTAPFSDTILM
jgi:hypothetical protein